MQPLADQTLYTMMIRGAGLLILLMLGASLASAATDPCDNTDASDFGEAYNNYYTTCSSHVSLDCTFYKPLQANYNQANEYARNNGVVSMHGLIAKLLGVAGVKLLPLHYLLPCSLTNHYHLLALHSLTLCANHHTLSIAGTVDQTAQDDVIGVISCRMPCKLKYNGVEKNSIISSNSFRVSWTFSPGSLQTNNSHSVTDTGYWMRKYGLSMSVLDPQCKVNTTALHSNPCEPAQLDCGLTIASCSDRKNEPFDGYYICRVQHRRTGAIFEVHSELGKSPTCTVPVCVCVCECVLVCAEQTVRQTNADYEPNCYHPAAVNVTAAEETINSTQMITVHWESTNRPEGIEYCHGSRRYSVYVKTFERAELDDNMDNGPAMYYPRVWYTNTTRARDTHYTIPPPISRDKYYTVQIQNRYKNTLGQYVYNQFASPIFYFGEQRKLCALTVAPALTVPPD